jgi:hypothetical protein
MYVSNLWMMFELVEDNIKMEAQRQVVAINARLNNYMENKILSRSCICYY